MVLMILYPAIAMLALFIVGIIMVMFKFGSRICGLRHTTLTNHYDWDDQVYEQKVSYA